MHKKLFFGRSGDIIEVVIRDTTGAKIESRQCRLDDKKATIHLIEWLKDKYGFESLDMRIASKKDWLDPTDSFLDI